MPGRLLAKQLLLPRVLGYARAKLVVPGLRTRCREISQLGHTR
jgi:hypothetical protein